MMKRLSVSLVVLGLLVTGAGRAKADLLYSQPSDFGSPNANGVASQNDTSPGGFGNFATAYDNFTLTMTATITNVTWQGLYFNPPTQGPITAFTIAIWANNPAGGGQPGAQLFTQTISGTANETFVGLEGGTFPTYNYSADISGFTATAGTAYWLSIVPDLAFPPQWGWHSGTGGDGRSIQDFLGTRMVITNDDAFTLNSPSPAVPEPASLTMLGIGAISLMGFGLRRRSKVAHS
jgi:hypothetical protein